MLLNRAYWRASHCRVRAERVTQNVHAVVRQVCATRHSLHTRLHHLPGEWFTVVLTEHARAPQVSMILQRLGRRFVLRPTALVIGRQAVAKVLPCFLLDR